MRANHGDLADPRQFGCRQLKEEQPVHWAKRQTTLMNRLQHGFAAGSESGCRAPVELFLPNPGGSRVRNKIVTPEDAPDGGMTPPAEFTYTYNGHRVEILPPDKEHLIGNYWQVRIDGVIRGNYVFISARVAAEEAKKLIDNGLFF
jgi:hypothetical protein